MVLASFVETLQIETTAWMRRPWMPRIPLEIRMAHRLGYEFVHEIRIGRGALSFRFGLDAYVGGHGLMKVGPSLQTGIEFDQGALIALWGEALCIPSAWERRTDIRWEAVDERTARLVVDGPEGEIPITVGFDPLTGCPASCTADRYKAKGPKVGWTGRFSDWRRFERRPRTRPVRGAVGGRAIPLDRDPNDVRFRERAGRGRPASRTSGVPGR